MAMGRWAAPRGALVAGLLAIALTAGGCALLAAPAVEAAGSMVGPTASGASGIVNAESTVTVNTSWVKNNNAQAAYYRDQRRYLARRQEQANAQRAAAAGIIDNLAVLDRDPRLADLARWVAAGGNAQFALGYALTAAREDAARGQEVRMLEAMSARRDAPELYELAQWVRAGGDANLAMNYALGQSAAPAAVKNTGGKRHGHVGIVGAN
jgi:hypothetical protein